MPMGSIFRSKGGEYAATYSYDEIISATGYITLYFGKMNTNVLSPSIFYSSPIHTDGSWNASGGVPYKSHDIDFDLLLNKQMILRGTALINATIWYTETRAGVSRPCYIVGKIRKWDGSTETDIATGTGNSVTMATSTTDILSCAVTVPETILKKEKLLD